MQGKAETARAAGLHVGIDVSKMYLDVYLHPLGERLRVTNDAEGHRRLVAFLARHVVALVLMEPTSRYHRALHRRLHEAGLPVALANPLRARLFAEACGQHAKTDAIDAAMLARMAERLGLDPVAPPTPEQEELQELASARQAAIAERIALANASPRRRAPSSSVNSHAGCAPSFVISSASKP
jgi:transposase